MGRFAVKAELSGTVSQIAIREGDRVEAEVPLLFMEAMKMEVPLLSPCVGIVAEVRVAESQVVTEGQVLVVIDI